MANRAQNIEVIDTEKLLQSVEGDKQLLDELVSIFFETSPGMLQQIRDAISTGDTHRLARAAHSLKGSVGTFAADQAYDFALQLEQLAEEGKLEEAEQVRVVLEEEIQRLKPTLKKLLENMAA